MELILYTNNSNDKVVTKNITQLIVLNGTLRNDCSIINPVIEVEAINNSIAAVCNYAKIAQFGRYYFVNDIIFTGKLYEIHMHVDVLASFQTQLKQLEGVIGRSEKNYNLYLQDGYFKTYQNPYIEVKQFPGAFDDMAYVLSVAGSGGYTPTPSSLTSEDDSDSM